MKKNNKKIAVAFKIIQMLITLIIIMSPFTEMFIDLSNDRFAIAMFKLLIWLIAIPISILFITITHELGHIFFGLLTKYKFITFKIFGFEIYKNNNKIKFRIGKPTKGIWGQALMSPPDIKNGKFPFALYNLGGILFNILNLIILIILYNKNTDIYLNIFLTVMIGIELNTIFVNGNPFMRKANDAYNMIYGKNQKSLQILWCYLKAIEYVYKGNETDSKILNTLPSITINDETDPIIAFAYLSIKFSVFFEKHMYDDFKKTYNDFCKLDISIFDANLIFYINELRIIVELLTTNNQNITEKLYTVELKRHVELSRDPFDVAFDYAVKSIYLKDFSSADKVKNLYLKLTTKNNFGSYDDLIQLVEEQKEKAF